MAVNSRYKQTDVGVIPEDWKTTKVGSVCKLINGRGFKPFEWKKTGLPIIRIQNLNGSEEYNYFQGIYDKKIEVEPGQLLFAWSGSRGTSFGPHIWQGSLGLLNYHTWKVQVREAEIAKVFFLHALRQLTSVIEDKAHGASALVHTQKWEMEGFEFPLPPTKAEQKAIAEALSDANALVESLEQLIAKKRQIKQGAMHELLTGKKRLPGFGGEWEIKPLDAVAEIRSGGTPSTNQSEFWDGDILWCTPTDITALNGSKYLSQTTRTISPQGLKSSSTELIPAYSVVMTSRATIGECAINTVPVTTNQGFKNFIPFQEADIDFLYYVLQTKKQDFISLCGGSTFLEIGKTPLSAFEIEIPKAKAEQTAIATILSDMDAEIAALEEKLLKARNVKQGMRNELLTGRIRLVHAASKVIPFPGKNESITSSTKSHNWGINEAVIIAVLSKHFGSEKYPLARKRCTKLTYLLHRHVEHKAEGYLKKAAGPYNPSTRYKGPEAIAQRNGYVRVHHNGTYPGFVAADNISQAETYFQQWYGPNVLAWLERFRFEKTDKLELLATVDMAMEDLRRGGKAVKLGTVKQVIRDHPEWEAKLQREIFSDGNIDRAIAECQVLFGS